MAEKAGKEGGVLENDSDPVAELRKVVTEHEKEATTEPKHEIEGIEQLRESLKARERELEAAKRAQQEAEQARFAAERLAHGARNEIQDSNLRMIETGMETLKSQSSQLKAQYAAALREGDPDRAAEINEAIADNRAKHLQLENGAQALKERPKQPAPQPRFANQTEAAISQLGITGRSADWVRAHPEFVQNHTKLQAMIGAHNIAMSEGVQADTDDYFQKVERVLGLSMGVPQRQDDDDPMAEAAQPVRRAAPPAAPVSRSGTATGGKPRTVRLTPQEIEMATLSKMTPEEYYAQKQRAIENNEITRH